jgi:preprotein translocase subunit SecG
MSAVVLVIHLILALAIIVLVLLQRSEGGGLGIGGGGGGLGGFATPQATANALTRLTWILAGCFLVTSLTLGILAAHGSNRGTSVMERLDAPAATEPAPAKPPAVPISE